MNQKALYHLGHSPNLLCFCVGSFICAIQHLTFPSIQEDSQTQTTLIEIDVLQNTKSEAATCHSLYIIGAKQAQAQLLSQ